MLLQGLCDARHEVQLARDQLSHSAQSLVHFDPLAGRLCEVLPSWAPLAIWEGLLDQPLLSSTTDQGAGLLLDSVHDKEQSHMQLLACVVHLLLCLLVDVVAL